VRVAVVGAGVTGLSVAWHVLARGLGDVVVLERESVGAGASGVQPGGVRQQWGTRVNCLMARDSLRFYRALGERLGTGVDPGFRAVGYLFLAHTHDQLQRLGCNVDLQRSLGIPSELIPPAAAAAVAPALDPDRIVGAAYCPEDGYFDRPQAVLEALAQAVAREGGEIRRAGVHALRPAHGGWALELAGAGTLAADAAVVAAGWETPRLLDPLGARLPIRRVDRHLFLSEPLAERLLEPLVVSPERHFAAKQLADGRLLASDLAAEGDPTTDGERWRRAVRANVEELLPLLQYVALPLLVGGPYDVTPDHQAIVGEVRGLRRLYVAAGFSGHGFMVAPETGRAIASLLAGEAVEPHVAELAPDRFARGRLVPEPQIV
jgi:sarcosine oxidase, subunit beta